MNQKIIRYTPKDGSQPVGNYSHITKIPACLDWYAFSGQIGANEDGSLSTDFNEQIAQTFININHILQSESMTPDNVVKVNVWACEDIDWDYFYSIWNDFFGTVHPSMTIAYVTALGLPEIKIEIEIWAAN